MPDRPRSRRSALQLIHVLEFFAFWYLLAAFFILTKGDSRRHEDDHFCACQWPPTQSCA